MRTKHRRVCPFLPGTQSYLVGCQEMNQPLVNQIRSEMKQIQTDLEAQKRVIKNSLGNGPVLAAAELELKALHTRQTVLEGNLKKLQAAGF